jgi:hypothetical protein
MSITSRPAGKEYLEGWDRIFKPSSVVKDTTSDGSKCPHTNLIHIKNDIWHYTLCDTDHTLY